MQSRIDPALNQFISKFDDVDVADCAIIDEICRMTPNQIAAAHIFFTTLTEDKRRDRLSQIIK